MNCYFVYILLCNDGSYYTGVTNDIEKIFFEHQEGLIKDCYTHGRRPLKLAFVNEFHDVREAIEREKQIKGWSRRKKEALIASDFDRLVELSRRHPSQFTVRQAHCDRAQGDSG